MSRLYIKAERMNSRTVLSDVFFTSPLKIAKPFYYDNFTEAMMMTASAGILDGDFYDIQLDVKNNAALKFTGQSYMKLFTAVNNGAAQNVKINLEENAELIYFPAPIIPFSKSIFRSNTEIYLKKSSKSALLDVISCGRKAMNEKFEFTSYLSKISVYVDDKLVFLDNQRLIPKEINLSAKGFFENHTHIGMMYIYGYEVTELPEISGIEAGISKAYRGSCIRIAGSSGDEIVRFANKIIKNF